MRNRRLFLTFLVLLAVSLIPLGIRPLLAPDEARYAEITREMLTSGDWIVPRLNGIRYFEKPVFGYWCFAGSMKCFGLNVFALRLPVLLSTFFTGVFLFFLMRCFHRKKRESALCSVVFLTMPLIVLMSGVGTLDGIFSFLLTVCIGLFLLGLECAQKTKAKIILYILCGIFAGLAFLTKGFLAFAIPALAAGSYLIWKKRWKELCLLPWLPLISALAVIAPWAWQIHRAEPDFWHYFIVVEHWNRFFGGEKAQHASNFFYFIPFFLGGTAVWLPFLPAVITGLKKKLFAVPYLHFSLCWLIVPFLFLSCSSGKLGSYILPCLPPFAILIASGLAEWTRNGRFFRLPAWIAWFMTVCSVCTILFFTINYFFGIPIRPLLQPGEGWIWLLAVICGSLAILAFLVIPSLNNLWRVLSWYVVGLLPLIFASFCIFPEYFAERRSPVTFLKKVHPLPKDCLLVAFHYPFQSVCWHYRRSDVFMISPGEIGYGLKYPDARHRFLDPEKLNDLIRTNRKTRGVVLVMATDRYHFWLERKFITAVPTEEIHGSEEDCTSVIIYQ